MTGHGIVRFTAAERVSHWAYAAAFMVLALTGAFLYVPWLPFSMAEAGETSRLLHRIFAVVLLASPLLPLIFSPRHVLADVREALTWTRDDVRYLWVSLTRYYWTGDLTGLPPQGKFTAGQKANIAMQIGTFLVMAATGLLLWLGRGIVPVEVLRWSVILHGLAAVFASCFVIVHVYMTTALPMTKEAIASMVLGTIDEQYVREHHPRWYPGHSSRGAERER